MQATQLAGSARRVRDLAEEVAGARRRRRVGDERRAVRGALTCIAQSGVRPTLTIAPSPSIGVPPSSGRRAACRVAEDEIGDVLHGRIGRDAARRPARCTRWATRASSGRRGCSACRTTSSSSRGSTAAFWPNAWKARTLTPCPVRVVDLVAEDAEGLRARRRRDAVRTSVDAATSCRPSAVPPSRLRERPSLRRQVDVERGRDERALGGRAEEELGRVRSTPRCRSKVTGLFAPSPKRVVGLLGRDRGLRRELGGRHDERVRLDRPDEAADPCGGRAEAGAAAREERRDAEVRRRCRRRDRSCTSAPASAVVHAGYSAVDGM